MSARRRSSSSGMRDDVCSEPSSSVTGATASHGCASPTMSSMPQDPACGAALRSGAVLVAAQRVAPGGPTAGSRSAYVSRSSKAADKQGDAGRLLARIQYLEAKLRHQEVEAKAALQRADLLGEQRVRLLAQVTQLSDNMQGMVRQNERLSSENTRLHALLHQAHAHSSSGSQAGAPHAGPGAGPHPGASGPFCQLPPPPHHPMHHSGGAPGPWMDPAAAGLTGQPPLHLSRSHSDGGLLALRQQLAAGAAAAAAAADASAAERNQHVAAAAGCSMEGPGPAPALERWLPHPAMLAAPAAAAPPGGSNSGGISGPCGPPGAGGALPLSHDPRPHLGPGPPGSNTPGGCHRLRFDQRAWSSPVPGLPLHPAGMMATGRPPLDMPPLPLPPGAAKHPVAAAWCEPGPPHHPPALQPPPCTPGAAAAAAAAAGGGMCQGRYATRGSGGVMPAAPGMPLAPPAAAGPPPPPAAAAGGRKRGRGTLSPEEVQLPPPAPPSKAGPAAGRQGEGGGVLHCPGDRRQGVMAAPGGRLVTTTTAPAYTTPFAAAAAAGGIAVGPPEQCILPPVHHQEVPAYGPAAAKRLKAGVKAEVPAAARPTALRVCVTGPLGSLDNDGCLLLPGGLAACSSPCQRVGSPAVTDSGASGDTAAHQHPAGGSASPSMEAAAQQLVAGERGGLKASSQLPSLPAPCAGVGLAAAAEMGSGDGLLLGLGSFPGMLLGGGVEETEELLAGAGWDWLNEIVL